VSGFGWGRFTMVWVSVLSDWFWVLVPSVFGFWVLVPLVLSVLGFDPVGYLVFGFGPIRLVRFRFWSRRQKGSGSNGSGFARAGPAGAARSGTGDDRQAEGCHGTYKMELREAQRDRSTI
jgi:hypothetical protein